MRVFTGHELKEYDGRDGVVYIACSGKVYDVSHSYHWRQGIHQVLHHAGIDLTDALSQAPHGIDMLEKFPVVGELFGSGEPGTG